jgi:hypothetical protein
MKFMFANLPEARPHPDPLPRGEGTAVDGFEFREELLGRWLLSICLKAGSVSPSPWGEGRGEGGRN